MKFLLLPHFFLCSSFNGIVVRVESSPSSEKKDSGYNRHPLRRLKRAMVIFAGPNRDVGRGDMVLMA